MYEHVHRFLRLGVAVATPALTDPRKKASTMQNEGVSALIDGTAV